MYHFKNFSIAPIQRDKVHDYYGLFTKCFANYVRPVEYIDSLYFSNPRGGVIGFDAFDRGRLVAHYACIPIKIHGRKNLSLLSINTATDPEYSGQGLFTELAQKTYDFASSREFVEVIGVANGNSVYGFSNKLGFNIIGNLNLRIGSIDRSNSGTRVYSEAEIEWLDSLKGVHSKSRLFSQDVYLQTAYFPFWPIKLESFYFLESQKSLSAKRRACLTVDWNKNQNLSLSLPNFLKPSPLTLIQKPLQDQEAPALNSWTFSDFDML